MNLNDKITRSISLKRHDSINTLKCCHDVHTIRQASNRTRRPLKSPSRCITIHGNDKHITVCTSVTEQVNMTRVEQIKDPISEDDKSMLTAAPYISCCSINEELPTRIEIIHVPDNVEHESDEQRRHKWSCPDGSDDATVIASP